MQKNSIYNHEYYTCHEIEFLQRLLLIGGTRLLMRYKESMPLRKGWEGIDRAKIMEFINAKTKTHRL